MLFTYPWFLSALGLIAIPIILHLFNLRKYTVVYFPDIRFLKQIHSQKKAKSQLKQILLLICRILAFTFLIIAFANPYIPKENSVITNNRKIIGIYIDNSYSMQLNSEKGNLLETAKTKAKEIIKAFSTNDQFILYTNDPNANYQQILNKEQIKKEIQKIQLSPYTATLAQIIEEQKKYLSFNSSKNNYLFILSDFQKNTVNPTSTKIDSTLNLFLIPVQTNNVSNISIDSCWFENPIHQVNQNEKLYIKITNHNDRDISQYPIKLHINNQQKALTSVNIPAHQSITTSLSFLSTKKELNKGTVAINDYPIHYDNIFNFTYYAHSNISILTITEEQTSNPLFYLYGKDATFQYTQIKSSEIDYSTWSNYSLIILDQLSDISSGLTKELIDHTNNGGTVVFIPKANAKPENYNHFTQAIHYPNLTSPDITQVRLHKIAYAHPLFKNIFESPSEQLNLPYTQYHFNRNSTQASAYQDLINLENGDPYLSVTIQKNGKYYLFHSPMDTNSSNITKHGLFVPLFWEIAISSIPQKLPFYFIDKDINIPISGRYLTNETAIHIEGENTSFIPGIIKKENQTILSIQQPIYKTGFYKITHNNKTLEEIALNMNRKESDLSYYLPDEIENLLAAKKEKNLNILKTANQDLTLYISEFHLGKRLWKIFIALTLMLIAIEVLLLRFLK